MDKINNVSNNKLMQEYVQFHLSTVMNMFDFLISTQTGFRIIIHDPVGKYNNVFPPEIYTDGYVILDIEQWSLEVASIDKELPYLYTSIAFGENPTDVTIDALDIARIFINLNHESPLYSRFFVPDLTNQSEPQLLAENNIHAKADLYASENKDAILHSMSCLTLLTKDIS